MIFSWWSYSKCLSDGDAGIETPQRLGIWNPLQYFQFIYNTKASVAIVNKTFIAEKEINPTLIKVDDAYKAFSKLLEFYDQVKGQKNGIEQPSVLSENVTYGENLYLGSFAYVGLNVQLGNDVKIYPNCYVGDNVKIGNNVTIFSGAKIYSDTIKVRPLIFCQHSHHQSWSIWVYKIYISSNALKQLFNRFYL